MQNFIAIKTTLYGELKNPDIIVTTNQNKTILADVGAKKKRLSANVLLLFSSFRIFLTKGPATTSRNVTRISNSTDLKYRTTKSIFSLSVIFFFKFRFISIFLSHNGYIYDICRFHYTFYTYHLYCLKLPCILAPEKVQTPYNGNTNPFLCRQCIFGLL